MARRISITVEDETWRIPGEIPAGARSRVVSESLRAWVVRHPRSDAVKMLDALRISLPITSVEEVARWVREDRERGRWPMYVFLPQVHANARVSAQS